MSGYQVVSMKLETLFIFPAIFAFSLLIIVPPLQVPDEANHWFRGFQLSSGRIIGVIEEGKSGGEVPSSFLEFYETLEKTWRLDKRGKQTPHTIMSASSIPTDFSSTKFVNFENTVVYSPLPYLPHVIAIWCGRFSSLPVGGIFYLVRVFNLAFSLGLLFLALKLMPVKRVSFLLLFSLPMTATLIGSASADAVTIGVAFLFQSLAFRLLISDNLEGVKNSEIYIVSLTALLVGLLKPPYPILAFLLIPPALKTRNFLHKKILSASIAASFLCTFSWIFLTRPFSSMPFRSGLTTSNTDQLLWVIENPLKFLGIFWNEIWNHNEILWESFIGRLGWLDTPLPFWLILSLGIVLFASSMVRFEDEPSVSLKNRLLTLSLVGLGFFLVHLLLYLFWNPVGGDRIEGVQGRYLIPFAPLLFASLPSFFAFRNLKGALLVLSIIMAAFIVVTSKTALQRFYL